jgi:hypothetical protein
MEKRNPIVAHLMGNGLTLDAAIQRYQELWNSFQSKGFSGDDAVEFLRSEVGYDDGHAAWSFVELFEVRVDTHTDEEDQSSHTVIRDLTGRIVFEDHSGWSSVPNANRLGVLPVYRTREECVDYGWKL